MCQRFVAVSVDTNVDLIRRLDVADISTCARKKNNKKNPFCDYNIVWENKAVLESIC